MVTIFTNPVRLGVYTILFFFFPFNMFNGHLQSFTKSQSNIFQDLLTAKANHRLYKYLHFLRVHLAVCILRLQLLACSPAWKHLFSIPSYSDLPSRVALYICNNTKTNKCTIYVYIFFNV